MPDHVKWEDVRSGRPDIVQRLRHMAPFRCGETCPMCDGAEEIERLRAVAEAADAYHDVACNPEWCSLCRALDAWQEARRG